VSSFLDLRGGQLELRDLLHDMSRQFASTFAKFQRSNNESGDRFRDVLEVHNSRINQHDHDIAELTIQLRELEKGIAEVTSQLNAQHDQDISGLRRRDNTDLQYLYRGLHKKIADCDHYKGRITLLEAQVEDLQNAGRRTRAQQPARKVSGRTDSGEVLEDALRKCLRTQQLKLQKQQKQQTKA
jgi:hypothetical protein